MDHKQLSQVKLTFVCLVTLITWSTLIWQHFNGGVASHYFLHSTDYPAISNWWGAAVLPLLSWLFLTRIEKQLRQETPVEAKAQLTKRCLHFAIAAGYGALLSVTFTQGYPEISSILFPGILFFAIFFKVYKEAFLLGFILSMSITFGAVLPTLFGAFIATLSFVVHQCAQYIWKHLKAIKSSQPSS